MALDTLRVNAFTHFDEHGEFAISVFSAPGLDIEQLALLADQPHPKIRISTAGRVRAAGYEIVRSEEEALGHADVKLPSEPTDDMLDALRSAFDDPEPNPAALR
jgi:hypothetical protein